MQVAETRAVNRALFGLGPEGDVRRRPQVRRQFLAYFVQDCYTLTFSASPPKLSAKGDLGPTNSRTLPRISESRD